MFPDDERSAWMNCQAFSRWVSIRLARTETLASAMATAQRFTPWSFVGCEFVDRLPGWT